MRFITLSLISTLLIVPPLAAQIIPETAVSSDVATFHNEERVAAAGSDGQDFLVVGMRDDDPAVYAHRVTASGELLDRTNIPIRLPHGASSTRVLGVFWSGDAYTVIVWTQLSANGIAAGQTTFAARIDGDGHLVTPARQIIAGRNFDSAASNGGRIVLAGEKLAVLDIDGNVLEESIDLPLQSATSNAFFHVGSNGSEFMLSWFTSSAARVGVNVAPLDANGHPTGALQTIVSHGEQTIASDGNDYVVLYRDASGNDYAQHVNRSGDLLQQSILPKMQPPIGLLTIVWNGSVYVVAASSGPSTTPAAARLNRNGQPLEITSIFEAPDQGGHYNWMNLAANGRQILTAWRDGSSGPRRWYGGVLENNLHISAKFPIGITATLQVAPSVATNGKNLFVVWEESGAIYGVRMSLDGQRLDEHPIKFALSDSAAPRVVWDGQAYVVAWIDSSSNIILTMGQKRVFSTAVFPDGTRSGGPQLFTSEFCVDDLDLASNGDGIFAVASRCVVRDLVATRGHRGGPAEPTITISPANMLTGSPRAAWNGTEYLVAWNELFPINGLPGSPQLYRSNIRAARVSSSMTLLDPEPLPIAVSDNRDTFQPLLATDGHDFMVTWTREAQPEGSLGARSVSADGVLGDTASDLGPGRGSSLIWDGRRFGLAFSTVAGDTFLKRIDTDSSTAIETGPDDSYATSLAVLGNGTIIAAYDRVASEPAYGSVPRVFVKTAVADRTRVRPVRAH
jgi:hypothetical protein